MLKIRLQRTGKKGQAHFRVVAVEHTKKPQGKYLELLGNYNPHEKVLNVQKERIEYWLSKGAQISPTVNNLMVNYKVWDRPKMESWKPKKKKEDGVASAPAPKKEKEAAPAQAAPEEAPAESAESAPEANAS